MIELKTNVIPQTLQSRFPTLALKLSCMYYMELGMTCIPIIVKYFR